MAATLHQHGHGHGGSHGHSHGGGGHGHSHGFLSKLKKKVSSVTMSRSTGDGATNGDAGAAICEGGEFKQN